MGLQVGFSLCAFVECGGSTPFCFYNGRLLARQGKTLVP